MTKQKQTIAIVVGEHSGDTLGYGLIQALRKRMPDAEFVGIGGPKMLAAGFRSLFSMEELAVMGIVEVVKHLPRLLHVRKSLADYFSKHKPDVFIGIDAPDFNIGLELKLKHIGIKTVHYVSPSVWAWREKRVFKIAKATNMVLSLLPFEKRFYDQHQVPCTYVGHTLADEIPLTIEHTAARKKLGIDEHATVLGIMPGSRTSELAQLSQIYLQTAKQLVAEDSELVLVAAMINQAKADYFAEIKQQVAPELNIKVVIADSYTVMAASHCLLMASGTATLEAALHKTPMVIGYRFNWLTYQLGKRLVKLKWFSLPNLLANEALVPELLQDEVTVENLMPLVKTRLYQNQQALIEKFTSLHQQLKCNASEQAAAAIIQLLKHD